MIFRYLKSTFLIPAILLAGCGPSTKLPPLQPAADMCIGYTPWQMSAPAAAVEEPSNLRAHAGNQAFHYEHCIANHPALDPARNGGPR